MSENTQAKQSPGFKWVIMMMVFLGIVPISYNQFQASILAGELMETMGMTPSQYASAMMASMFVGVFTAIIGGVFADKIGPKKTVAVSMVLSIIGCFARIPAKSYGTFFFAMFLLGFAGVFLSLCSVKLFAAWFPPEQMGVPMGVMMSAGTVGTALAQSTTALYPSMKTAFSVGSIFPCIMLVVWLIVVKDKPAGAPESPHMPVLEPLKKALKSRNVWVIGICSMCFMGFQMTFASFYPTALQTTGIALATAGVYASIFTLGGFFGNIILPSVCAKVGVNKPTVLLYGILAAVLAVVGWNMCSGITLAIVIAIAGFFGCGAIPPLMGYPALLKEIGPMNAASAAGLVTTLQMLGAFVLPSYVITPIATAADGTVNYGTMFMLAAISIALLGIIALILPELGTKALAKRAAEAEAPKE